MARINQTIIGTPVPTDNLMYKKCDINKIEFYYKKYKFVTLVAN